MGRQPEASGLSELKQQHADSEQPLNSLPRRVQPNGNSLYVNLTKYGAETHDISAGDEVSVETYPSGIWIEVDDD